MQRRAVALAVRSWKTNAGRTAEKFRSARLALGRDQEPKKYGSAAEPPAEGSPDAGAFVEDAVAVNAGRPVPQFQPAPAAAQQGTRA